MIPPALASQVHHHIYKSESASRGIEVIQRSNLHRSSHLAIREDLMQAGEGVSELAIEAHEQAKVHCAEFSSSRRPQSNVAEGIGTWAPTILPGSSTWHLREAPSRVDCIGNLGRVRAILCQDPVSTRQFNGSETLTGISLVAIEIELVRAGCGSNTLI